MNYNKGNHICGFLGDGKSRFAIVMILSFDYDIVKYDAGDIRNKSLFDTTTCNNTPDKNVLHMMNHRIRKTATVMDKVTAWPMETKVV